MIRIATIEGDYVRDTQVFSGDPTSNKAGNDSENCYFDVKYPNLFVGIYEAATEEELCIKAASSLGVHPNIITLTEINLKK